MSDMSSMSCMELGLVYGRECLFYRCTMLLRFTDIRVWRLLASSHIVSYLPLLFKPHVRYGAVTKY